MRKLISAVTFILVIACSLLVICYMLNQNDSLDKLLNGGSMLSSDASGSQPKLNAESKKPTLGGILTAEQIDITDTSNGDCRTVSKNMAAAGYYGYLPQQAGLADMKTEAMRTLYHALVNSAYSISDKQNSKGYYCVAKVVLKNEKMDESNIRVTISAFENDNPQIFWISNVYSYAYYGQDTVVQLYSYITADQCSSLIAQLNTRVEKYIALVPANLSEFERELKLYDLLAANCSYDSAAVKDSSMWRAYTVFGALVNGKAVCEGYSRAMQLLLSYAGMQCRLVNGEGQSALHMWNLVRIDRAWYHLDATWNDGDDMADHAYFNLSDAQIRADHVISPLYSTLTKDQMEGDNGIQRISYNLSLPSCNSDAANYFRVKGAALTSYSASSDRTVIAALSAAAQKHSAYFTIYVANNLDYDGAVSKLFLNSPYKFLYYVNEANREVSAESRIRYDKTVYVQEKVCRGITVKLSYQ